jgi:hypothetical protein
VDRIDDLFLSVLASNLETAEKAGQTEIVDKLKRIGDILMSVIQESQPPEIQFINELLAAEYPTGTRALLDEHGHRVDERLLDLMQAVGDDLNESGRAELAERLAQIRAQAKKLAV